MTVKEETKIRKLIEKLEGIYSCTNDSKVYQAKIQYALDALKWVIGENQWIWDMED